MICKLTFAVAPEDKIEAVKTSLSNIIEASIRIQSLVIAPALQAGVNVVAGPLGTGASRIAPLFNLASRLSQGAVRGVATGTAPAIRVVKTLELPFRDVARKILRASQPIADATQPLSDALKPIRNAFNPTVNAINEGIDAADTSDLERELNRIVAEANNLNRITRAQLNRKLQDPK